MFKWIDILKVDSKNNLINLYRVIPHLPLEIYFLQKNQELYFYVQKQDL